MTPFFETTLGQLYQGECMDLMAALPWHIIDLILADLPFGQTANDWDKPLPFSQLWWLYRKLCKPQSPILLFGQEPFSSKCRLSNLANFKCDWKWIKSHSSGSHFAKRRPLQRIDDIMVFSSEGTPFYNPLMIPLEKPIKETCNFGASVSLGNSFSQRTKVIRTQRYPNNVLEYPSPPRRVRAPVPKILGPLQVSARVVLAVRWRGARQHRRQWDHTTWLPNS